MFAKCFIQKRPLNHYIINQSTPLGMLYYFVLNTGLVTEISPTYCILKTFSKVHSVIICTSIKWLKSW